MTATEIWLLERAEPLYKIYPWKALLRAGSRGCAETDYGQNLMRKMMMSYDCEDWFSFIGFDAGWGDGVCCFHIAVAMIYSNDFCVSEFSHKKYLRFRID